MSEIFRTRDVTVFEKDLAYTISTDSVMRQAGWPGAQGLMWKDSIKDEFLVTFADGVRGAGFALWGSEENSDTWTALTGQQVAYGYTVVCSGSWLISVRTYEKYTYASRTGGGPLVPLNYATKDKLLWSLRGYFTKEDEWSVAVDPRAPNTNFVGQVIQPPTASTNNYLTIQTTF